MEKQYFEITRLEITEDSPEAIADTLRRIAAKIEDGYSSGVDSRDGGEYNWQMNSYFEELEGAEFDNAKEELVDYIKYLISDCEPVDEDGNGGPMDVICDHPFSYVTPGIVRNHITDEASFYKLCEYLDSEEIMEECICKALEAYDEALAASN